MLVELLETVSDSRTVSFAVTETIKSQGITTFPESRGIVSRDTLGSKVYPGSKVLFFETYSRVVASERP